MNELTPEAEAIIAALANIIEDNNESGAYFRGAVEALTNPELLKAQKLYTEQEVDEQLFYR